MRLRRLYVINDVASNVRVIQRVRIVFSRNTTLDSKKYAINI